MKNKEELGENEEICSLCKGVFELEELHPIIIARKHIGNACSYCEIINKNKLKEHKEKMKSLRSKLRNKLK
jgi:hypothetical protein